METLSCSKLLKGIHRNRNVKWQGALFVFQIEIFKINGLTRRDSNLHCLEKQEFETCLEVIKMLAKNATEMQPEKNRL